MSAHIPTPWKLNETTSWDGSIYISNVVGPDGQTIRVEWFALSVGPEPQANAKLIVRAVNSHADLLAALRPFANYACNPPCKFSECHNCQARAAIEKASV